MKTFQQLLAVVLLVLVIGISAFAGEIGSPVNGPCPVPSPSPSNLVLAVNSAVTPAADDDANLSALAKLALDLVLSALTMH